MPSTTESGQLQPHDTLDDRGVDDILDKGISPPEKLRGSIAKGTTHAEQIEGGTIEDRLRQEEPEPLFDPHDDEGDDENADPAGLFASDRRSGRIPEPNEGSGPDLDNELIGEP